MTRGDQRSSEYFSRGVAGLRMLLGDPTRLEECAVLAINYLQRACMAMVWQRVSQRPRCSKITNENSLGVSTRLFNKNNITMPQISFF